VKNNGLSFFFLVASFGLGEFKKTANRFAQAIAGSHHVLLSAKVDYFVKEAGRRGLQYRSKHGTSPLL